MSRQVMNLQNENVPVPVQENTALNVGAVAIEQERAIAEAQGQLVLAKRFPRNEMHAHADLMSACKSPAFASVAFYSVPRAGGAVTGPSIRLAEEIARVYGNFEYGHRELSRDSNKSEVEVYAWDKERNNRSIRQITVYHTRDTKNGQIPLRDQKDIDDKIANVASKQVRGRILALMPKWLVEDAIQECRRTIAGNNEEPVEVRVRRMTQAFARFGVTVTHLEAYLGHPMGETLPDEIVDLQGIFNAIREGTPAKEFFATEIAAEESAETAAAITDAGKSKPEARTRGKNALKEAAAEAEKSKAVAEKSKQKEEPAAASQQDEEAKPEQAEPEPQQHVEAAKDADEDDVF